MKLIQLFFVCLFISSTNTFAQYTDDINSNRPGNSMSAFSVGKTVLQVESGLNYINENHSLLGYTAKGYSTDLTTRYGFFREELEAVLNINYQNDCYNLDTIGIHRRGIKTTTFGFKYLVYDPLKNYEKKIDVKSWKANHRYDWHSLIPSIGIYAGLNINSNKELFARTNEAIGTFGPKAMLITQNILPRSCVLVTNVFMDQYKTSMQTLGYVVTLTKGFNDHWSGFIENRGLKNEYYSDGIFTGGAAYLLSNNIQIDASVSRNYKDTPKLLYIGLGASWRFDGNYDEVLYRVPNKDKGKKEKVKTKKRKGLFGF
ncbi:transporter [Flavobacterium sp.]|uniref:transporter n=1 Tax=Flavobacterium sp. TaxID=239 RepID=UPI0038D1041C